MTLLQAMFAQLHAWRCALLAALCGRLTLAGVWYEMAALRHRARVQRLLRGQG